MNSFDIDFGQPRIESSQHDIFTAEFMQLLPETCHSRKHSLCPTEETLLENLDTDEKVKQMNNIPVSSGYVMPMINTLAFLNKRSKSQKPVKKN